MKEFFSQVFSSSLGPDSLLKNTLEIKNEIQNEFEDDQQFISSTVTTYEDAPINTEVHELKCNLEKIENSGTVEFSAEDIQFNPKANYSKMVMDSQKGKKKWTPQIKKAKPFNKNNNAKNRRSRKQESNKKRGKK